MEDLEGWRLRAPAAGRLVFARSDGAVFRDTDYRNWRKREFDPMVAAAGAGEATPYTLRHSFASLLVQAGWNALEIAVEMGNSPEVVQRDYSHLFREFARGREVEPTATILEARKAVMGCETSASLAPQASASRSASSRGVHTGASSNLASNRS